MITRSIPININFLSNSNCFHWRNYSWYYRLCSGRHIVSWGDELTPSTPVFQICHLKGVGWVVLEGGGVNIVPMQNLDPSHLVTLFPLNFNNLPAHIPLSGIMIHLIPCDTIYAHSEIALQGLLFIGGFTNPWKWYLLPLINSPIASSGLKTWNIKIVEWHSREVFFCVCQFINMKPYLINNYLIDCQDFEAPRQ